MRTRLTRMRRVYTVYLVRKWRRFTALSLQLLQALLSDDEPANTPAVHFPELIYSRRAWKRYAYKRR